MIRFLSTKHFCERNTFLFIDRKLHISICTLLPSEVFGAASVDEGVHAGVQPAQPRDDLKHYFRYGNATQKSGNHIQEKKREPANDEDPHDGAQGLCGLLLLGKLCKFSRKIKVLIDHEAADSKRRRGLVPLVEVRLCPGRVATSSTAAVHSQRHGAVAENGIAELLSTELQTLGVLHRGLVHADVREDHDREGAVERDC